MPPPTGTGIPDVIVIGGGPVGLTTANLLGARGIRVVLVERNPTTSDDPKAISLDDESMRTLQQAELDVEVYPIIVPGTGTKYLDARGRTLVYARAGGDRPHGHPGKNPFAQPELERVLLHGLSRFPHVDVRLGTTLESFTSTDDGVRAALRHQGSTTPDHVSASYLLACDGGRSTVRGQLSIAMEGRSFPEVWLVIDALDDPHDERFGMHHGNPDRPHVIVPGRNGRCRYEFLLKPGEGTAGSTPSFSVIEMLLRPYRTVHPDQIERAVNYSFHALIAERFSTGRCFLLGDAAHMMPPFAGQGLNSGLRDAANLAWKIATVVNGDTDPTLLDTYDIERRPHARAMVDLSVRLRSIVMTTHRRRAMLRDVLVNTAMRFPRGRRYLGEMRFRPSAQIASGAVVRSHSRQAHARVGTMLPQPMVLQDGSNVPCRLDDILGSEWSTIGIGVTDDDWRHVGDAWLTVGMLVDVVVGDRAVSSRHGRRAVADVDGRLSAVTEQLAGLFLLIRPDRVIAAVFAPADAPHTAPTIYPYLPLLKKAIE